MHVMEEQRVAEDSAEIALAGSLALQSVGKYVSSLLAVIGKKTTVMHTPVARAPSTKASMREQFATAIQKLNYLLAKVEAIQSQEIRDYVKEKLAPSVMECLSSFNDAERSFEELEIQFNLCSRDERRKHSKEFRDIEHNFRGSVAMAETLSKIMDALDPTPEDYLLTELSTRYGDRAGEVLSAFTRIDKLGAITSDDFKKRFSEG